MPTQAAFHSKNYIDAGQEIMQPQLNDLFIFIGPHRISYVIARRSNDEVMGLRVLENKEHSFYKSTVELSEALSLLQVQKEFGTLRIMIDQDQHLFVPEPLFVGEKASAYLSLNFEQGIGKKVLFNRLPQKNMVSVFSIDNGILQEIKKAFPEASVLHQKELLLDLMYAFKGKNETDKLFLFIREHTFEIGHLKNGSLHFLNSFPHEADTDIIYFLLSVMEALKLNPEKTTVMLLGDINPNGSLPGLMKKYIPFAELMKRPSQFHYPASFREFAEHQHYLEISSLFCES